MIKIILFEDRPNLRESLQLMLAANADFELVEMHPNCRDAVPVVMRVEPDVVLMDIDMPEVDGITGVRMIKEARPETQIVMLTVFEDDAKIFDAIKAGADGYLLKKDIPSQLFDAIYNATSGGSSISPGVATKVLQAFRAPAPGPSNFNLSKRELEVLELLVKGHTYKRIAADTFVSIDTVRSHIKNIYLKLQVNSATEAVAKALQQKLVI
ncbi:MAG: response regulator transcription factor [Bacteroidetes bacterium]|nr:response regulator transcription factor [Bacteroidota bacterium]